MHNSFFQNPDSNKLQKKKENEPFQEYRSP